MTKAVGRDSRVNHLAGLVRRHIRATNASILLFSLEYFAGARARAVA